MTQTLKFYAVATIMAATFASIYNVGGLNMVDQLRPIGVEACMIDQGHGNWRRLLHGSTDYEPGFALRFPHYCAK